LPENGESGMTENEIKKLLDSFFDAYNHFDSEGVSSLLHQNIEYKAISGGELITTTFGIDEFCKSFENSKTQYRTRTISCRKITLDKSKATAFCDLKAVISLSNANGPEKKRDA
jgi:hypothetical protein